MGLATPPKKKIPNYRGANMISKDVYRVRRRDFFKKNSVTMWYKQEVSGNHKADHPSFDQQN